MWRMACAFLAHEATLPAAWQRVPGRESGLSPAGPFAADGGLPGDGARRSLQRPAAKYPPLRYFGSAIGRVKQERFASELHFMICLNT